MFVLTAYLFSINDLELPSRYGASSSVLEAPVLYIMAMLPLSFGVSIVLAVIDRDKYSKHCKIIVTTGVVLFFFGLVVVAPILNAK